MRQKSRMIGQNERSLQVVRNGCKRSKIKSNSTQVQSRRELRPTHTCVPNMLCSVLRFSPLLDYWLEAQIDAPMAPKQSIHTVILVCHSIRLFVGWFWSFWVFLGQNGSECLWGRSPLITDSVLHYLFICVHCDCKSVMHIKLLSGSLCRRRVSTLSSAVERRHTHTCWLWSSSASITNKVCIFHENHIIYCPTRRPEPTHEFILFAKLKQTLILSLILWLILEFKIGKPLRKANTTHNLIQILLNRHSLRTPWEISFTSLANFDSICDHI